MLISKTPVYIPFTDQNFKQFIDSYCFDTHTSKNNLLLSEIKHQRVNFDYAHKDNYIKFIKALDPECLHARSSSSGQFLDEDEEDIARTLLSQYVRPGSYYYDSAFNSNLIIKVLRYKSIMNDEKITFIDILNVMVSLMFQYTQNPISGYHSDINKVPHAVLDRFVCHTSHMNKDKLYTCIDILHRSGCIELFYYKSGIPYVSLDIDLLNTDPLIVKYFKRHKNSLKRQYSNLRDSDKLQYLEVTDRLFFNRLRKLIIGIVVTYSMDSEPKTFIEKLRQAGNKVNQNLLYGEIPFRIIEQITGLTQSQILAYVYKVCRAANYISIHDMMYSEVSKYQSKMIYDQKQLEKGKKVIDIDKCGFLKNSLNLKHYIVSPEDYKEYQLVKLKELNPRDYKCSLNQANDMSSYNDTQLELSLGSVIIYKDKLRQSETGSYILDNINVFRYLITNALDEIQHIDEANDEASKNKRDLPFKVQPYNLNVIPESLVTYKRDLQIKEKYEKMPNILYDTDVVLKAKYLKQQLRCFNRDMQSKPNARTSNQVRKVFKEIQDPTPYNKADINTVIHACQSINSITKQGGLQENCRSVDLKYYANCILNIQNYIICLITMLKQYNKFNDMKSELISNPVVIKVFNNIPNLVL